MNKPERSLSLDIFRGLAVAFMILVNTPGSWSHVYAPLAHATWHGYTPTDLVFPFFLLAVGMALSYSAIKLDQATDIEYFSKVVRRALILFLIGVGLAAFPFLGTDWENLRIPGVLQRIALTYLAASGVIRYVKSSCLPVLCALILITYWGLLHVFGEANPYSLEGNAVLKLDRFVLGEQHLWTGLGVPFDPEGILSTLPATVNVLAGYYIGVLARQSTSSVLVKKLLTMAVVLIIGGLVWDQIHPINKSLWTGSFVLVSVGWGCALLAVLSYMVDLRAYRRWISPFLVFGMNPLFIYVFSILGISVFNLLTLDGKDLQRWLFELVFRPVISPEFGSLLFALAYLAACWLAGYTLYRRKIFIKV